MTKTNNFIHYKEEMWNLSGKKHIKCVVGPNLILDPSLNMCGSHELFVPTLPTPLTLFLYHVVFSNSLVNRQLRRGRLPIMENIYYMDMIWIFVLGLNE